jgi:hypothetical protein
MADECRVRNIAYVIVIAPNKATIYPEYLPDWMQPFSDQRLADLVYSMSEAQGLSVLFPRKALEEAKSPAYRLYFSDDSHWNERGAWIALEQIWQALARQQTDVAWPYPEMELALLKKDWMGDLAVFSGREDLRDTEVWRYRFPGRIATSHVEDESPTENFDAFSGQRILLLRDSFSTSWHPFLASAYRDMITFHNSKTAEVFPACLDSFTPDVFIYEIVERCIGDPPSYKKIFPR